MKNDEDITDLPVLGQEFLSDVPVLGGLAPAPRGTAGAPQSPDDEDDPLPDLGASGVPFPPYGKPRSPAPRAGLVGAPPLGAVAAPPPAPVAVVAPAPPQVAVEVVVPAAARPQVAIGGAGEDPAPVATATPAAPAGGPAPRRGGGSPAVEEGGVRLGGYGEDVAEAPIADVLVVHGTGKVVVPPDSACVELHVEAKGSTAEAARSKGAEALESALAAVKGVPLGKASTTLRTESVRTYPEYERDLHDFDEDRMRKVVGYHARGSVSATIREAESATALASAVAQVMDAASKAGAMIGGVSFDLDKPEQASCDALGLAVADARRTADVLVRAAGVALGRLHSMAEDPPNQGHGYRGIMPMAAAMSFRSKSATPTPVEAGDVTVVRTVTCRWRFGLTGK